MKATEQSLFRLASTVSFLKRVDLFRDVPTDYLASLARIAEDRTLYPGEKLFSEGDPFDGVYLICEGALLISAGGTEVALLGTGECVGEMSLCDELPRSAGAAAVGETRLLRIGDEDFSDLMASQPSITMALLKTVARRLRQAQARRAREAPAP